MLLSHQLVLVAVDAEGRLKERQASLEAGLAGGLLMELALSGCIKVTGGLIAVRRGSFADPFLEETARRLADRVAAGPAEVVADLEGRDGAIRHRVLEQMENLGLGERRPGGIREMLQDAVEARETVLLGDDGVRFVPSTPDVAGALTDVLTRAVRTLEMAGDTAALLALAMASGLWRPPRQSTPMRFEDSLLRQTLDRVPRSVRSSAEAVIQGVAARTLASRVERSVERGKRGTNDGGGGARALTWRFPSAPSDITSIIGVLLQAEAVEREHRAGGSRTPGSGCNSTSCDA